MSSREIKIRTAIWIGPSRRLDSARDVEIRASKMVLEYPDAATAEEVAAIIAEAADLRAAFDPSTSQETDADDATPS